MATAAVSNVSSGNFDNGSSDQLAEYETEMDALGAPRAATVNAFTGQDTNGSFEWMKDAQQKSADEQTQALQTAYQREQGGGPSVARSQLGQQWANQQAQAGALSSAAGGNMSPMARRQAMLATGGVSSQLAGQAGTARSGEQAAAVGAVGTLSAQGRAQDTALGGQMADAENTSQNLSLERQADIDQATAVHEQNKDIEGTQLLHVLGDMHPSGGGQPVDSGIHLMEPGGDGSGSQGNAHWIIREEPNFLLAVNARDGKMRKILTGELTPEEHTQAMKSHGAGPIGSHNPANLYAGDLDLKRGGTYGDATVGQTSVDPNTQFSIKGQSTVNNQLPVDPTTGKVSGTQAAPTGNWYWGGNYGSEVLIPGTKAYTNPNESYMVGLQQANQTAQQGAENYARQMGTSTMPSFGQQLAAQETKAGAAATASQAASAMGRGAGEFQGQAQTQQAQGAQQLGATARTIQAQDYAAGQDLAGQLAGQSRAQDQALVAAAQQAAQQNEALQIQTRNEPLAPSAAANHADVTASNEYTGATVGAFKDFVKGAAAAGDLDLNNNQADVDQAQGDEVDQFLAYHRAKMAPGKVTLPEQTIQSGGGNYETPELEISGSQAEGKKGEEFANLAKYTGGDVEAARAHGQDLAREPDFYAGRVGLPTGNTPDIDQKMKYMPTKKNISGVQEVPEETISVPAPKAKVKPLTKKYMAADLDLSSGIDSAMSSDTEAKALKDPADREVLPAKKGSKPGYRTIYPASSDPNKARGLDVLDRQGVIDTRSFGRLAGNKPKTAGDLHIGGIGKGGGYRSGARTGKVETGAIGAGVPKVTDALSGLSTYTRMASKGLSAPMQAPTTLNNTSIQGSTEKRLSKLSKRFLGAR